MKTKKQTNDRIKLGCLLVLLIAGMLPAGTDDSFRDLFADTWVPTDALGRSLPGYDEAGPPRPNRMIGLFYFLWPLILTTAGLLRWNMRQMPPVRLSQQLRLSLTLKDC